MQKEITRAAEKNDTLSKSWNNTQMRSQQMAAVRTVVLPNPNPWRVSARHSLSPARLLARLEAENVMLRQRAAELALNIQKLAERP